MDIGEVAVTDNLGFGIQKGVFLVFVKSVTLNPCDFYDSWFMVHGSRFMVHGSWFMVHGSWFTVHGSRFLTANP